MRKMTNSAGLSGATPTRTTSRPLSRSFWVIVERSQRTNLEFVEEKILDGSAHVGPQRFAVGLKHCPLRPFVYRVFEVGKVAPQVDVLPLRVGTDCARAPQTEAASFEEAEAIDALRIQHFLLRFV